MSAVNDTASPLYLRLAVALAPGWQDRPWIARVPAAWLPLAASLVAAGAAISVLVAASYAQISTVAVYLAVATLLTALGRLAKAFPEARHAGEQAHLAQTDELTGLLNRRGFYNHAAPILAGEGSNGPGQPTCALLLLDLDHFKDVNDSLGHAAGDELLRRVAARLSASLREEDILARLGGDEFAIILPHVGIERAVQAAVALTSALEQTVVVDGLQLQIGASIGIAIGPEHGRDLGARLGHADIAMYRAKYGHAPYSVYTPDADERVATRRGMELRAQLRHAIEHEDLAVHYQPKLCLATGEIVGVEAFVRWDHPERGLLYPDQFLPLVRHSGRMHAMTELVVQRALEDAAAWHALGHRVPVAVNLFPPTLADLDLPARLDDALRRQRLTSAALAVEITEDFLLGNLDRARVVLDEIHRLGITIAIDDFGSGNSSLNHLRHLPIDEVKLDRSFTASITEDPRVAAIVRSVIDLSHNLGLTTVAEGVETAATASMLTGYGCEFAQGHHYSQPLTASQFLDLLAADATEGRKRQGVSGLRSGQMGGRRQDSDRHQFDAGQRHSGVALGCGDDGLEAFALFPDVHLELLAGEHHACEAGAVTADA
jgi:diguanylate cyclase